MNPLGCLCAFALLTAVAKADRVLIVGAQDGLVHEAVNVKDVAQFSRAGLAELALDAFGIATGNVVRLSQSVELPTPQVQSPVQADVFEHVDAYAMVFVDNIDATVVESVNTGMKTGYHKVFDVESGTSPEKLSLVLAKELQSATTDGDVSIKCIGNVALCHSNVLPTEAVKTVEFENVFTEHAFLDRENDADVTFAREVALMHQLLDGIAASSTKALYVVQYSSLQALDTEKCTPARSLITKQVHKLLTSLRKAYPLSGAQVIASTKTTAVPMMQIQDVMSYGRMLLSFSDVSAADDDEEAGMNGSASGNATANSLTMEEIAEYQIILWTSVILGSILVLVLIAMCNMAPPRDSLLYAKFITSNNGRKLD